MRVAVKSRRIDEDVCFDFSPGGRQGVAIVHGEHPALFHNGHPRILKHPLHRSHVGGHVEDSRFGRMETGQAPDPGLDLSDGSRIQQGQVFHPVAFTQIFQPFETFQLLRGQGDDDLPAFRVRDVVFPQELIGQMAPPDAEPGPE